MYCYGQNCSRPTQNPDLIDDIANAINGEYTAIHCYGELAELAPTQEERNRILEIRSDEMRHFQTFSGIYRSLTGRDPAPQIVEECPTRYVPGLHFSFNDEQKAVDFYHEIADKATHPYVKHQFTRAAADEQNHAVWFLYFITENK